MPSHCALMTARAHALAIVSLFRFAVLAGSAGSARAIRTNRLSWATRLSCRRQIPPKAKQVQVRTNCTSDLKDATEHAKRRQRETAGANAGRHGIRPALLAAELAGMWRPSDLSSDERRTRPSPVTLRRGTSLERSARGVRGVHASPLASAAPQKERYRARYASLVIAHARCCNHP